MTYFLQRATNNLIQALCEVLDIVAVEARHRNPPIASHVDMRTLNHGLALLGIQASETVAKRQLPNFVACYGPWLRT